MYCKNQDSWRRPSLPHRVIASRHLRQGNEETSTVACGFKSCRHDRQFNAPWSALPDSRGSRADRASRIKWPL